jgi:hypothetical protein
MNTSSVDTPPPSPRIDQPGLELGEEEEEEVEMTAMAHPVRGLRIGIQGFWCAATLTGAVLGEMVVGGKRFDHFKIGIIENE